MNKYIILIIVILFSFSCNSYKRSQIKYATETELKDYTGPYYVFFSFSLPNSHLVNMGGIGDNFDVRKLKKDNLNDFIESFYSQLDYAPHIMDLEYSYNKILSCLGYSITWYNKYHVFDITSGLIERINLELEDGVWINIRIHRILGDIKVKYVEDFRDCIKSSSIELDINKINSIDRVAILLDKED